MKVKGQVSLRVVDRGAVVGAGAGEGGREASHSGMRPSGSRKLSRNGRSSGESPWRIAHSWVRGIVSGHSPSGAGVRPSGTRPRPMVWPSVTRERGNRVSCFTGRLTPAGLSPLLAVISCAGSRCCPASRSAALVWYSVDRLGVEQAGEEGLRHRPSPMAACGIDHCF